MWMHYYCCRREIGLQRATTFILRADKKRNQNFGHSVSSKTPLRRYKDNINRSERNTEECVVWSGLTLNLLRWKMWWVPNNASRWQMRFNSAFKGLNLGQERDKYQTTVNPVMNFGFPWSARNFIINWQATTSWRQNLMNEGSSLIKTVAYAWNSMIFVPFSTKFETLLVLLILCYKIQYGISLYTFMWERNESVWLSLCCFHLFPWAFVTKFVRFSFVLIILWNVLISYKKESTNTSFIFIKSQNCGVRTSTCPTFYTKSKAMEISAKVTCKSSFKVR